MENIKLSSNYDAFSEINQNEMSPITRMSSLSFNNELELGIRESLETACNVTEEVVIYDIGAFVSKIGTTASDEPEMYIPSVIGAPKFNGRIHGDAKTIASKVEDSIQGGMRYGLEAYKMANLLSIRYPIECSTYTDWDDFSELMMHSLAEMNSRMNRGTVVNIKNCCEEEFDISQLPFVFTEHIGNTSK